jgi:diphthine synthase
MTGLTFIGLGLDAEKSVSVEGVEKAKKADIIYLDVYTSPIHNSSRQILESMIGLEVKLATRDVLEDGGKILDESRIKNVVLLCSGDPMVATTHMDLRVRAEKKGILTEIIHNASILSSIPGETGLQVYRFGKTVTMTESGPSPQTTVYNTIYENLLRHLHTTILLEYDYTKNFFLDPTDAMNKLIETEIDQNLNIIDNDTFIIVASRLGSKDRKIKAGQISNLKTEDFGRPPHIMIIPGSLHFTEKESLATIIDLDKESISDNSAKIVRLAEKMVKRYVEKGRIALEKALSRCSEKERERYSKLFENVECYMSDSERFLNQGRDELAILSIGYAEGLLDALRFIREGDFEDLWK